MGCEAVELLESRQTHPVRLRDRSPCKGSSFVSLSSWRHALQEVTATNGDGSASVVDGKAPAATCDGGLRRPPSLPLSSPPCCKPSAYITPGPSLLPPSTQPHSAVGPER